jgi:hypothetical protein
MGFTYSGFALTSLPHKPQTDLVWKREGHNLTMLIESGRNRAGEPLGIVGKHLVGSLDHLPLVFGRRLPARFLNAILEDELMNLCHSWHACR